MNNLVQKFKDMWTPPEDEFDEDYEYEEQQKDRDEMINKEDFYEKRPQQTKKTGSSSSNKVLNIHTTAQLQVVLFKPERFGEETRNVADELLKTHTVVLNLEDTNKEISRRIIDFLSGVAYANGGKIKRVATGTFIITPYNVDLTGDDILDELENSGMCF